MFGLLAFQIIPGVHFSSDKPGNIFKKHTKQKTSSSGNRNGRSSGKSPTATGNGSAGREDDLEETSHYDHMTGITASMFDGPQTMSTMLTSSTYQSHAFPSTSYVYDGRSRYIEDDGSSYHIDSDDSAHLQQRHRTILNRPKSEAAVPAITRDDVIRSPSPRATSSNYGILLTPGTLTLADDQNSKSSKSKKTSKNKGYESVLTLKVPKR